MLLKIYPLVLQWVQTSVHFWVMLSQTGDLLYLLKFKSIIVKIHPFILLVHVLPVRSSHTTDYEEFSAGKNSGVRRFRWDSPIDGDRNTDGVQLKPCDLNRVTVDCDSGQKCVDHPKTCFRWSPIVQVKKRDGMV